jgi:DedD protein
MAKTISEEELQLRKRARRRLIGAIALVTMVAVFLPMILDHEPKPVNQDVSIQIPTPSGSGTFTSKIVPVVPTVPDATLPVAPTAPTQAAAPAKSEPVAQGPPVNDTEAAPPKNAAADKAAPEKPKPQAKPAVKSAAKPPAKTTAALKTAAKSQSDAKSAAGYVVQVAALNDAAKAKEMQEKMVSAGVKAYTEVVPTKTGNVTRVRAGPYTARADAEKMRDRLKELGLNGNIVPK